MTPYLAQDNSTQTSTTARFQQFYYDAWRTWGVCYSEMYRDLRAYAGDNWTTIERTKLDRDWETPHVRQAS